MQKTKLGISVGLLGAAIYAMGLFGGFLVTVLLAGYVLLFEENPWLRIAAVKAVALTAVFGLLSVLISFLPSVFSIVGDLVGIFTDMPDFHVVYNIFSVIGSVLRLTEDVLLVVLALKALNQGTIHIPVVDPLIRKHMH